MSDSEIQIHLFEYGGGIVVGMSDVDAARTHMRRKIREDWESASPGPWQMYDFTYRPPSVERGRVMEDSTDLDFAVWQRCDDGVDAVV